MAQEESIPDSTESAPPPADSSQRPVLEYRNAKVQTLQYSSAATAPDDWIHIFRSRDYLEANLLVGKLQESGFHARVDMENVATMGAWAGGGAGGTNVQVMASEAAEARRVIDELEKVRAARRAKHELRCPKCNQQPVKRQWRRVRLASLVAIVLCVLIGIFGRTAGLSHDAESRLALGLLALGIVLLMVPALPRWRCPACGHEWAQAEPEEEELEDEEEEDEDDEDEDDEG